MTSAKARQTSPGHDAYLVQSRRPLAALAFVLPLVLIYELGTWRYHLDAAAGSETRIVAFTWIRRSFAHLGATGAYLAPAAVIGLLLGWHVFSRQRWRLRMTVPLAMLGESLLLAVPLMLLAGIVSGTHLLQDSGLAGPWLPLAVLGIGAGVYEELLFRLIGFVLLHAILVDLLSLRAGPALIVTLLATSVAFALYHHLGGEPLTAAALLFRTTAGIWLGLIFATRGYGIAAGAHAAYDVALVALLAAQDA